jgi:hypothetical protein
MVEAMSMPELARHCAENGWAATIENNIVLIKE